MYKHSEETKEIMSRKKKELYKNFPNKHNWKSSEKFLSKPCINFKKILNDLGINFVAEYTPLKDRFFSIDIAFPDRKIGIEINGNQHYEKDGSLKKYYKDRHDLIENDGWKLYEVHFSLSFDNDVVKKIIKEIHDNSEIIFDFDYDNYLLSKLNIKKVFTCECGKNKYRYSKKCITCYTLNRERKVNRPNTETLLLEVAELGYSGTGRKYGVSDNCIRKWIKPITK